jgi:hypothetical protein
VHVADAKCHHMINLDNERGDKMDVYYQ